MKKANAIERHRAILPSIVLEDFAAWKQDPELQKLVASLDRSRDEQFFDFYAEVLVARNLIRQCCKIRVEVPNPQGKASDFEVSRGGLTFFLHIKRLGVEDANQKQLNISTRLRKLEQIQKPFVVHLVFPPRDFSDKEIQFFVKETTSFLKRANAGEKKAIRVASGVEIGECSIGNTLSGSFVRLGSVSYGFRSSDVFERVYGRLSDAYKQFMPNTVNVILVNNGGYEDLEDFDNALLGTERVTVSPNGEILKTERLLDGFWSKARHPESQMAGWFKIFPGRDGYYLSSYCRSESGCDPTMRQFVADVFKPGNVR